MNKLLLWYQALQQREQRVVAFGGGAAAFLILVFGLLMPLHSAVSRGLERNETKREDLTWMQLHASEIRDPGIPLAQETNEAPVLLVNRIGREAGLTDALRGSQPSGTGVRVQLEAAPFDVLVSWFATLDERYGFAVESVTVDRAARPGVVNATVTFTKPPR